MKKNNIIYQVYFPSFVPTIKDLIKKLSYLKKKLKVNMIWLNPIYPSGRKDCGYDITNYKDIDHAYGTLKDFDILIKKADELKIKIMMDLVFNHTSNQHPWFLESKSSKINNKKDWYCWYNKDEKEELNKWESSFMSEPWTWCEQRQQFYYHRFYSEQPDLNLQNHEVIKEIKNIIDFWIARGVRGFRLDAVGYYIADKEEGQFNTTKTYSFLEMLTKYVKKKNKKIIILAESEFENEDQAKKFIDICDLSRNEQFATINKLDIEKINNNINFWYNLNKPNKIPLWYLNHHDLDRQRYGEINPKLAKLMAALYLLQYGTKIIYYGEELNMRNSFPGTQFDSYGRDKCRSIFPWTDNNKEDRYWIPPHPDDISLKDQLVEPKSVFNHYKFLTNFQKNLPNRVSKCKIKKKSNILQIKNKKYKILLNFSDSCIEFKNMKNIIYRSDEDIIGSPKCIGGYEVIICEN